MGTVAFSKCTLILFYFLIDECRFLVVLIVMSGTSLVPYGFTVLNGCLVIAASVVMSPCITLLNVELSCPILYFF